MLNQSEPSITTFDEFAMSVDYSLMDNLNADPESTEDGDDRRPRQVFSGHFVPVMPTPIKDPEYVTHSSVFFNELGMSDKLVHDEKFKKVFCCFLALFLSFCARDSISCLWHKFLCLAVNLEPINSAICMHS